MLYFVVEIEFGEVGGDEMQPEGFSNFSISPSLFVGFDTLLTEVSGHHVFNSR